MINLLIKPVSGLCNLKCRYCFYEDLKAYGSVPDIRMTEQMLRILIERALETGDPRVLLGFQGGEPLLAGLDFYRSLIRWGKAHAKQGVQVEYTIQTNGTLLDAEWADFFRDNRFLVGLSIDGTEVLHDLYRRDAQNAGTYRQVCHAAALLMERKVPCSALCVITGQAAKYGAEIYDNLKELGFTSMQFIPCLDPLAEPRGTSSWSLSDTSWMEFLKAVFDRWYADWEAGHYIRVRQFDDYVRLLSGSAPSACAAWGGCGSYLVVEADGSVYPCDFFVLDRLKLGNLADDSIPMLLSSAALSRFVRQGTVRPAECESCPYRIPCGNGGCMRDFTWDENGAPHQYFCDAYRGFFAYAWEWLNKVAQAELLLSRQSFMTSKTAAKNTSAQSADRESVSTPFVSFLMP